jgi:hypothetical protein
MLVQVDLERVSPDDKIRIIESLTSSADLAKLSNDYAPYRVLVAKNPHTSLRTLWKLSKDKEDDVREAVANNSTASAPLLAKLAEDSCWKVRLAVANNKHTSLDTLNILIGDSQWCCYSYGEEEEHEGQIRIAVSLNPNTSEYLLYKLKIDFLDAVRANVAKHPNMDSMNLGKMYRPDEKYSVLRNLAQNPKTPEETIRELNKWTHPSYGNLHLYLAGNPSTPADLLESYANVCSFEMNSQENLELEEELEENPSISEELELELALADNPSTPAEALEKLSKSPYEEVLLKVVAHENTSLGVISSFFHSPHWRVQNRAYGQFAKRRRRQNNANLRAEQGGQ